MNSNDGDWQINRSDSADGLNVELVHIDSGRLLRRWRGQLAQALLAAPGIPALNDNGSAVLDKTGVRQLFLIAACQRMNHPEAVDYRLKLERAGIQATPQRQMIARQLFRKRDHLTAYHIHQRILAEGSRCSRATVYNNLNLFVEKGLLNEIRVSDSGVFYDTNTDPHPHVYYTDTGELRDLELPSLNAELQLNLPPDTVLEDISFVLKVRHATG